MTFLIYYIYLGLDISANSEGKEVKN
jgi:hypothetical protein